MKIVHEDPVLLRKRVTSIPEDLETIVMKSLEKEPPRRYESAKALGEDLERYLNDEPVLARRAGIVYRAQMKIRKHRAIFVISLVAILFLTVLAALSIRTGMRAEAQARLAQAFGQEVEKVEGIFRQAQLIPPHDTRKERNLVKERMRWIESEMKKSGSAAMGPGHYALGKGFLALGEYPDALNHLQQAWNKFDYRTDDMAYVLGLAYAMRYREELPVAARISNKEEREAKKKQIQKEFGVPAMQRLRQARTVKAEAVEYGEALLAYLSEDYALAVQKCQAAANRIPWRFESLTLLGDIYLTMGETKRVAGDNPSAQDNYAKAEKAYTEALRIGQSASTIYEGLCGLGIPQMWLQVYVTGEPVQQTFEKTVASCNTAIQLNPESATAYQLKCTVLVRWAGYQMENGEDPRASLSQAISSGEKAIQLRPENPDNFANLGFAFLYLADDELNRGAEPENSYRKSIEYYKKAIQLNPNAFTYLSNVGLAYIGIAEAEISRGDDPLKTLGEAIKVFDSAKKINPKRASVYANHAVAYWDKALFEVERGLNFEESIVPGIAAAEKAIELNPDLTTAWNSLGGLYVMRGLGKTKTGSNPSEDLKKAISIFTEVLVKDPENYFSLLHRGQAFLALGGFEMRSGADPGPVLNLAIDSLQKSAKINSNWNEVYAGLANAGILLAENQESLGKNPEAFIAQAKQFLESAIKRNGSSPEVVYLSAKADIVAARYRMKKGRPAEEELKRANRNLQEVMRGRRSVALFETFSWMHFLQSKRDQQNSSTELEAALAAIEKTLSLNPRYSDGLALKAILQRSQAEAAGDQRKASEAQAGLKRIIQENPLVHPVFKTVKN